MDFPALCESTGAADALFGIFGMKQDTFPNVCESAGLGLPVAEYKFHPTRKWRFDYCWPDKKVALEVEGGVWTGGRHTRGSGFVRDILKYNSAAILGWRVLRCTPQEVRNLTILNTLREAMK